MLFGPFSESDISRLSGILDQYKAHYVVDRRDSGLHLEIAESLVALVADELEKIGALTPVDELSHEEFLCSECDYISLAAGNCPTHGIPLLDYSAWVDGQSNGSNNKTVAIVFAAIIVIALIYILNS